MAKLRCTPVYPALRHRWHRGLGKNAYVANDATVRTLELKQCDTSLVRPNLDPPIAIKLQLQLVEKNMAEGWNTMEEIGPLSIKQQNATLGYWDIHIYNLIQ